LARAVSISIVLLVISPDSIFQEFRFIRRCGEGRASSAPLSEAFLSGESARCADGAVFNAKGARRRLVHGAIYTQIFLEACEGLNRITNGRPDSHPS
jgi:hypothetical protein